MPVSYEQMTREELGFLVQTSAALASSFDYRANLAAVARQAVPVLADLCVVDMLEADGSVARVELAFADRSKAAALAPFREAVRPLDDSTPIGLAMLSKKTLLIRDCSPAGLAAVDARLQRSALMEAAGAASMMIVPIVAHDTVLGALTLATAGSSRSYSEASLGTPQGLAAQMAIAIDSARLYERAQRAIRAREDVLSFVSHDLRNPLMGILLTTDSVLRAAPAEERRKGWRQLERIRRAAQQMRHMIDDLLDVASLDAGRLIVDADLQDVGRLLDDARATMGPLAADLGVGLTFQAPAAAVLVRCDRHRVVQVLSNLIGNAIKFTPAGGSITVSAQMEAAHALFAVSDTGPGISAALRPHVFERFWQADQTARKGSGLGLYIAKGLIEAQGGAIWVDSPSGGGATFSFTLPLAAGAELLSPLRMGEG